MEKSHITIEFPELLPVSIQRQAIMDALQHHQVIIVCGETGSGKTTQLSKICLLMGRGRLNGTGRMIGHTQPRRIAATATAKRIAQELGSPLGQDVGFQVRFSDKTSATTSIKLMTDGILLAQTQQDPLLKAYDTLIIDEAHERSLNIDFLLGYLKQILPKRPDLKVIITSATLDADLFVKHFSSLGQAVPIIEVSGRLFPVEIRYRPLDAPTLKAGKDGREGKDRKETQELSEAIVEAISELWQQGVAGAGDILVFLPGEREIRECAIAIKKDIHLIQRFQPTIMALFARQSVTEQERIFQPDNSRRIVLATNVAETSLTVPGIRFVIDTGVARMKRYSYRNKVEQLHIEPIAQSAARQRAGRCGRVADGICVRLYSEEDFFARPVHTDPEILRSSLAAVILKMASLKLSRINEFPFLQAPQGRAISDGIQLLEELGAVESEETNLGRGVRLTAIGIEIAQLPLDPRVGRILLAAKDQHALREVLIIATALAILDPRERPAELSQAADQAHRIFVDEQSEFLSYMKLWDWYQRAVEQKMSQRSLEQYCRGSFVSARRMREWKDVHSQLQRLLIEQGWKENTVAATYEQIHTSLLTGLLGNIAKKAAEDVFYEGARGIKLSIWPGSFIGKKVGAWIVAAELVETHRIYARTIAKIDPRWVEKICPHRLVKSWSEPFWDTKTGEVMAHEQGSLYGLALYHGRKVRYGLMDPAQARQLFIQRALVEGVLFGTTEISQLQKQSGRLFHFFWHNVQMVKEVEAIEHRSRRQDVLVNDLMIAEFYDSRLPKSVLSRATLQAWLEQDGAHQEILKLQKDDLMRHEALSITDDRYPKKMVVSGTALKLSYHFEPGSLRDGVTLELPLAFLNQIDTRVCEWLVPGLCIEKVHLYLKTLPQKLRRHCVPLPNYAKEFVERSLEGKTFYQGDLLEALMKDIWSERKVSVKRIDFRPENIPVHCLMNFRLVDEHGRQLELDRRLDFLRSGYAKEARAVFQEVAMQAINQGLVETKTDSPLVRNGHLDAAQGDSSGEGQHVGEGLIENWHSNEKPVIVKQANPQSVVQGLPFTNDRVITEWSFGELPELLEMVRGKQTLYGYPALVDQQAHCVIQVFDDPAIARRSHFIGLRRLFSIAQKDTIKSLNKQLPNAREIGLLFMQIGTVEEVLGQIIDLALERSALYDPLPHDQQSFELRLLASRGKLALIAQEIARQVLACLEAYSEAQKKLAQNKSIANLAHEDMSAQLKLLIHARFVATTPYEQLVHLPRYLRAIIVRLDKLRSNPVRDGQNQLEWQKLHRKWLQMMQSQAGNYLEEERELAQIRWQFEELRVVLFAQELKTPTPMSIKRLEKILLSYQG